MRRIPALLLTFILLMLILCPIASAAPPPPQADKVVYVAGDGNLYWRYVEAGPAHRLTKGGSYAAPKWSPTGRWILALKGDQFTLIASDTGKEQPLEPQPVQTGSASWAPNEDVIAATGPEGRIDLIYPDHPQRSRNLVPPGNEGGSGPIWSPDGRRLAYAVTRGNPPDRGYAAIWSVSVADGRTRELYALRTKPSPCYIPAAWAETGQILFWVDPVCSASILADGAPLLAVPAGGGAPREIVHAMLAYRPFLALRGHRMAAVVGGGRSVWFGKELQVIDLSTGERTRISAPDQIALAPDWAPDGRRLAYTGAPARNAAGGEEGREALYLRRIWVAAADGSTRQPATGAGNHRDEAPTWLSGGNRLLFVRVDQAGNRMLRTGSGALANLGREEGWFGYYGWTDYSALFDLWRRPTRYRARATPPPKV